MENIRPIYKKLLIAAIVIYITGVTFSLANIYMKVGEIEHALTHASGGHQHDH
ncbi:MAG: hypothetical protein KKH77_01515 [Candidatus Omnitrophica bacterium]|nr:hypothetical protein [Candidatus Omnitrophota bacterium]MBU1809514.1 hypothetical protein [Candidatus Omnitrophota bacterium]